MDQRPIKYITNGKPPYKIGRVNQLPIALKRYSSDNDYPKLKNLPLVQLLSQIPGISVYLGAFELNQRCKFCC